MNKTMKTKPIISMIFNGKMVETLYDPATYKTQFVIFEKDNISYEDTIEYRGEHCEPMKDTNDLLRKRVILLPSKPIEYGNEQLLIESIQSFIHKYLDISPLFEQIASYYVLFSWIFEKFNEVPYLRAIGDFGSGKTRFLQTVGSICYKPIFTAGSTTVSPIFRILDQVKGTLILDEADFRSSDMKSEIVKILNSGYSKGFPVMRSEGKGVFEVKTYNVFSPKIIATRESFNDKALESRFLIEEMGRGTLRKDIPRTLIQEFHDEALELRNKLLMWRSRNIFKKYSPDENLVEGVHPRLQQIVLPLLSVIKSEEMRKSLHEFIKTYNTELIADRGLSWESDVVYAINKLNEDGKGTLTVKEITDAVNEPLDVTEMLHTRKVGWIMRSKLQLKTYRTRDGFTLSISQNEKKLNFWKERLGVDTMNDVNNVNDSEEPSDEDVMQESNPF